MAFQKKCGSWLNLPPVRGKLSHMELNFATDYALLKRNIFTSCYSKGREIQ